MSQYLIAAFQDTQRLLWENQYLCQLTSHAVMCTQIFPENYDTTRVMGSFPTAISVTDEKTLQAARRMVDRYSKVGVLNFANAVNPGGGVIYGAQAQEEDLCRCSNLYSCLMKPELYDGYYGYHNSLNQYYSDRIIYSPNLTVFKTTDSVPKYTNEWFQIDVLSCSAPNLNGISSFDYGKLQKIYNSRIRNILAVAEAHGIQALVLGSFGCDAFGNPPELMAKAFLHQLTEGDYRNTFREVVFAIHTDTPQGFHNLQVFCSVLSPWQQNPLYEKKISILGDSISTYWGSNPGNYKVFYDGEQCLRNGIYSVKDTWWMKVVNQFGGKLLVNGSYSGSKVSGTSRYAAYQDERLYSLQDGNSKPDVILIAMGSNDYGHGVPIEWNAEEQITYDNFYKSFRSSYQMMLWKIGQMYPNAEIYCATLNYGTWDYQDKNPFPNGINGIGIGEYNKVIRACALEYGCRIVDLEKIQKNYDTLDGMHPTVTGMAQLAEGWIRGIEDYETSFYYSNESVFSKKLLILLGSAAGTIGVLVMVVLFMLLG